jgi:hypothetical protein
MRHEVLLSFSRTQNHVTTEIQSIHLTKNRLPVPRELHVMRGELYRLLQLTALFTVIVVVLLTEFYVEC